MKAAAAYTALTLVLLLPLPLHIASAVPSPLGDQLIVMGFMAWETQVLPSSPTQTFEMPILFPARHALAFSEHLLGALPFAWPVIRLTENPVLAYNLILLLSFVLCAVFMRLLVFELTNHSEASFLAGLLYAFTHYRLQNLPHLQLLLSFWMPLSLLGLIRFAKRPAAGAFALCAGAYTMQALSCWYYAFYFGLALAFVAACWLYSARKSLKLPPPLITRLAAIAIPMLLLIAWTAKPYLELQQAVPTYKRSLSEMAPLSADPRDWLVASDRSRTLGAMTLPVKSQGDEHALFPGIACLLLLVAAWRRRKQPSSWFERSLWIVLPAAFLFSLGPSFHFGGGSDTPDPSRDLGFPLPYRLLHLLVPGLSSLRAPARFAAVFGLAAAVLAGIGFARAFPGPRSRKGLMAAFFSSIAAFEFFPAPLALAEVPSYRAAPAIYTWLREQPPCAVAFVGPGANQPRPSWSPHFEAWQVYWMPLHGHETPNGFTGFLAPEFIRFRDLLAGFPSAASLASLRDLGVRIFVVRTQDAGDAWPALTDAVAAKQVAVIWQAEGFSAYRIE